MVSVSEGSETRSLQFRVEPDGGEVVCDPAIGVVAGFTGRDRASVLAHLDELSQLGVPVPERVPTFYAVAPQMLTQGAELITTERGTSGEAEVGLVVSGDTVYVTLASDHTDRAAERIDISLSKRLCHKVVSTSGWRLDEIAGRWDSLRLRSWIGEDDGDLYQDGHLAELLTPLEILGAIPWRAQPDCFLVLCGTVPTIGGLRESTRFRAELFDPHLEARLELDYRVVVRDMLVPSPTAGAAVEG
jgi:hypothetical protein